MPARGEIGRQRQIGARFRQLRHRCLAQHRHQEDQDQASIGQQEDHFVHQPRNDWYTKKNHLYPLLNPYRMMNQYFRALGYD